jgi:hypothetical protein
MTTHKFEIKISRLTGYYRAVLTDVTEGHLPHHMALESDVFVEAGGDDERRNRLRTLRENLGYVICMRAFPEDTEMYDMVDGKPVNYRYPEPTE